MPIRVANIDLSAAVVGSKFTITIGQATPPPTLQQQMNPRQLGPTVLKLYNESPCGFLATWPLNNQSFSIAAGQWPTLYPPPNETELRLAVAYILPNATVDVLLADLFLPGEPVYDTGALGNSPVNGGAQVTNSDRILDSATGVGLYVNDDGPGLDVELRPTANNRGFEALSIDNAGNLHNVIEGSPDGSTGNIGSGSTNFSLSGKIGQVGSLPTAGNFGFPPILVTSRVTVAVTTLTTTHTYTPPAVGTFLIGATFRLSNGTPGQPVTLQLVYNDGFSGAAQNHKFQIVNTTTYSAANAVALGNGVFACTPLTIRAAAGSAIQIQFRDAGGTPNDTVEAFYAQIT